MPAVLPVNPRPARNGGDPYRHDPDPAHATVLGEFITYARPIRAGKRWLAAQDRRWRPRSMAPTFPQTLSRRRRHPCPTPAPSAYRSG